MKIYIEFVKRVQKLSSVQIDTMKYCAELNLKA